MSPFKAGVTECYQFTGALTNCTDGDNGVPPDLTGKSQGALNAIATAAGEITATPNAYKGITPGDTCVLTPTEATAGGYLNWDYSGACVDNGWVSGTPSTTSTTTS